MNGYSTLTQKGQATVPKAIRDHFGLKAKNKLYFSIEDNKIVAKPIPSIEEMFGSVKTKKVLSKAEYKEIIRKAVVDKFERKNANNA